MTLHKRVPTAQDLLPQRPVLLRHGLVRRDAVLLLPAGLPRRAHQRGGAEPDQRIHLHLHLQKPNKFNSYCHTSLAVLFSTIW